MKKRHSKAYGHHCSVIEQKRVVAQMSECDANCADNDERLECYAKVTELSGKRERACMFS